MLDKEGNRFCCWMNGYGQFEDGPPDDWSGAWSWIPGWIQDQGKFEMEGNAWKLEVGISHHDEEWRMANDIKDFLLVNHGFLHTLAYGAGSRICTSASTIQQSRATASWMGRRWPCFPHCALAFRFTGVFHRKRLKGRGLEKGSTGLWPVKMAGSSPAEACLK